MFRKRATSFTKERLPDDLSMMTANSTSCIGVSPSASLRGFVSSSKGERSSGSKHTLSSSSSLPPFSVSTMLFSDSNKVFDIPSIVFDSTQKYVKYMNKRKELCLVVAHLYQREGW